MSHPGWTGAHVCKKTVVCVLSSICVCTHVLGTRVVRSERAPGCAGVGCTDADSPGHVLRPPVGWMRAVCREEPLGPFARSADTHGTDALSFLLWGFPFSGLRAAPALPRVLLASKEELGGGVSPGGVIRRPGSLLCFGGGACFHRDPPSLSPLLSWPCQESWLLAARRWGRPVVRGALHLLLSPLPAASSMPKERPWCSPQARPGRG